MNILNVLSLFCFFTFGISHKLNTPLSVVNPYELVTKQLLKAPFKDSKTLHAENFESSIKAKTLLQFYSKNFSNTSNGKVDLCAQSIATLLNDVTLRKNYALKMLDSWAKLESGILEGNLKWLGLYYECLDAKPQKFSTKYCSVFVGSPAPANNFGLGMSSGVTLGGCYPDTCSSSNISSLFSPILHSLNSTSSVITTCPVSESNWDGKDIFGLFVLCLLLCIVIASTTYDYVISRRSDSQYLDDLSQLIDSNHPNHPRVPSKTERVLTSFSVIQNTKRLLVTKQRPSDIHCLHGIRFLSMCWVILGHSFLFPVTFTNNLIFMARYYVEHWEFQAIGNATFSVDSFFFLSGLLVAYLGLRQLKKSEGRINVPVMYLHRYIRLTPPYALLILLSVSVWPKVGSGPMWPGVVSNMQQSCAKYWYTNLLYFNNLYPVNMGEECYGWGWYLANDTQFYLLSPIFLVLLYYFPLIGMISSASVAVASIAVTGAFSSHTNQQPQALGIGLLAKMVVQSTVSTNASGLAAATPPPQYSQYMTDLYAKPWCRIGAYLVGIMAGYIVYSTKLKMSKWAALLGWVVAATTNCLVLYGLYPSFSKGNLLDVNTAAFYNAVSRPVWCMGLAWVVIACVNGYGGPVNTFLSWRGFIPLSRLTYCTYLVHPLVIWWLVGTSETLYHYNIQLMIMVFLGTLVLSSLLAYFVSMIIEMPVVELMKILQNRDGNTAPNKQPSSINVYDDKAPLVNEADA